MQFYFLSVILNFVGGILIASTYLEDRVPFLSRMVNFFNEKANIKLIMGLATGIVGIIKLLLPVSGWAIVGDLLPALAGMAVGFCLLVEYYHGRTDVPTENQISDLMDKYKHIIGLASIGIAVLHLFLPNALFL